MELLGENTPNLCNILLNNATFSSRSCEMFLLKKSIQGFIPLMTLEGCPNITKYIRLLYFYAKSRNTSLNFSTVFNNQEISTEELFALLCEIEAKATPSFLNSIVSINLSKAKINVRILEKLKRLFPNLKVLTLSKTQLGENYAEQLQLINILSTFPIKNLYLFETPFENDTNLLSELIKTNTVLFNSLETLFLNASEENEMLIALTNLPFAVNSNNRTIITNEQVQTLEDLRESA
jgi:hypothetical protein